ncbi:MAG: hypothetical protein KDD67_08975 [Ignavibacteriae bacterium]|nr:hypothetical protein [Ignavibacteriota bacterium]MCB9216803.1 hypothetical protein [Ignavibacteria bacterium]
MKQNAVILSTLLALTIFTEDAGAQKRGGNDYLNNCIEKQVDPLQRAYLQLTYRESENNLYHSSEPWQTAHYDRRGRVSCSRERFFREDTISQKERNFATHIQYSPTELLKRPYWSEQIGNATQNQLVEYPLSIAYYSPIPLLDYAQSRKVTPDKDSDPHFAIYSLKVGESTVRLYVGKSDRLLQKVTKSWNDGMLGDMTETFIYTNFTTLKGLHYPQSIEVVKVHNIRDTVHISSANIVQKISPLLEKPEDYTVEDKGEEIPELHVEKLSEHLYGLNLPQAESRAILVEFKDFLMVVDVPFNSENGDLVLREAEKIAPGKPVRYFAFCHHHPWYLGGVRPFIHRGATVICTEENLDYVRFLATAPHTIEPDSLQLNPSPLIAELVDSIMTISDGEYEVKICHIGKTSAHTSDYLIFYFPLEKIVVQGDLAWIPTEAPITKAGPRQVGLYNGIKEFGLEVETILQTWPISEEPKVKSAFPFSDLEESIHLTEESH